MDFVILELINTYALINELDRYVVAGLIQQESGFNTGAIGDNGHSFGLMQLYDQGAGSGYPSHELLNPTTNVMIGTRFLRSTIDRTDGTIQSGLSAYNQGVYGWQKRGISLNQQYVDNVLANAERYRDEDIFAELGLDVPTSTHVGKRYIVMIEKEI